MQEIFYYPFGELKYNSGSDIAKYKFTDQEFDGETTLYNYGARYYDPHLARFVSADTIVPQPFNPQSLNRYSYASNNPVLMIDPDGHDDYYCCGGGGGGGGGDDDWCRIYGCTGSEEPPSGGGGGGNGGGEPAPPPPPLTWSPNIVPVRMNPMTFTGVNMNSRFGFGTNMPATVTGGNSSYNSIFPVRAESSGSDVVYRYYGYSEIWSGGSRSWRNNNPGNLVFGEFARNNGSLGKAGGFAIFPNYQTGYGALMSRLQTPPYSEWTLTKAIEQYAPPCCNNTAAYIQFVTNSTGINANTTLGVLNSLKVNDLANTIQRYEGYVPGTVTPSYDMRKR